MDSTHSVKRSDGLHRLNQRVIFLVWIAELFQRFFMRYLLGHCFETWALSFRRVLPNEFFLVSLLIFTTQNLVLVLELSESMIDQCLL